MKLAKTYFIATCILLSAGAVVAQNPQTMMNDKAAETKQEIGSHDGEIIAFIIALDNQEINAANIVAKKKATQAVVKYAQMMKTDHGKNLTEVNALSEKIHVSAQSNAKIDDFKKKGQEELHTLATLNSHEFETAYIDAMVKGHTTALEKMDKALEQVTNPELKNFVMNTRDRIEMHLAAAKKIQGELKK